MKNSLIFAAIATLGLSACETPATDTLTLNPEGIERVEQMGVDAIAPSVSPQVAVNTFSQYCGRFPANPRGTRNAVEAAGYVLFVSGSSDELDMFASPDGGPMVATGRRDGAEVCMVLMKEGRDLSSAVASYVTQKHGNTATRLGSMPTPEGTAENVWLVPGNPPLIYFTLVQEQMGIGRVEAFAQVTE